MTNTEERERDRVEEMPVKRNIRISLIKTEPSGYPIAILKAQMTKLGLTCGETSQSQLEEYKREVMQNFPKGKRQVYHIAKGKVNSANDIVNIMAANRGIMNEVQMLERMGVTTEAVNGSWVIDDDAGGYRTELCRIAYAENFDKLQGQHPDQFTGQKESRSRIINEPTGAVIRDTFSEIATTVCNTVKSGITPEDLESIVSCIIGDNTSENPRDYEQDEVLLTYLINGYDPETETANAVGVLALSYKIHIKDYLDKSDHKDGRFNDAEIVATARFVSYSDVEMINRDLGWLDQNSKEIVGWQDIPVPVKKITVYENRPVANKETFNSGLPVTAPGAYADSLIFYSPDLENVGYIDNRDSEVTTTYSRSVTVGFSHSSEFSISSEVSMELDCEIAKCGVKMGVSMTMTDEWNKSHEETVSYEVGAGKEAYLYQGKLRSVILRYDPKSGTYGYLDHSVNTFSAVSVKTTTKPIKSL